MRLLSEDGRMNQGVREQRRSEPRNVWSRGEGQGAGEVWGNY